MLSNRRKSGDVVSSSRRLTRPRFPYVPAFPDDHAMTLQSLRRPNRPLHRMGIGLQVLSDIQSDANLDLLVDALDLLGLYSLAVEDYITGGEFGQHLAVIADQRNLCQHALLSLLPAQPDFQEDELAQLCRAAGVIYSLLCVYPILLAEFAKLGKAIKTIILRHNFERVWAEAPTLMVWVVTMAAIASTETPQRVWFVGLLDRCLAKLRVQSWEGFKKLLQDFLWLPATNDADGYDLWLEVRESNPFQLIGSETPDLDQRPFSLANNQSDQL
jgi:hypothetical protein